MYKNLIIRVEGGDLETENIRNILQEHLQYHLNTSSITVTVDSSTSLSTKLKDRIENSLRRLIIRKGSISVTHRDFSKVTSHYLKAYDRDRYITQLINEKVISRERYQPSNGPASYLYTLLN